MTAVKLITAPDGYPVSTDEAKKHLNVDHDDDNDYIEGLLAGVTAYMEGPRGYTGRALIEQTWDVYFDCFPVGHRLIELPLPPVISVDGVFSVDASGNETEFSASNYLLDSASEPARIALVGSASWPTNVAGRINQCRIRMTCGYVDGSQSPPVPNVPPAIKSAVLMLIGSLYANREEVVLGQNAISIPFGAKMLLEPYIAHKRFA